MDRARWSFRGFSWEGIGEAVEVIELAPV